MLSSETKPATVSHLHCKADTFEDVRQFGRIPNMEILHLYEALGRPIMRHRHLRSDGVGFGRDFAVCGVLNVSSLAFDR
jgi:hypothetical protein